MGSEDPELPSKQDAEATLELEKEASLAAFTDRGPAIAHRGAQAELQPALPYRVGCQVGTWLQSVEAPGGASI